MFCHWFVGNVCVNRYCLVVVSPYVALLVLLCLFDYVVCFGLFYACGGTLLLFVRVCAVVGNFMGLIWLVLVGMLGLKM